MGASVSGSGAQGKYEASWGGGGFMAGYELFRLGPVAFGGDASVGGWSEELCLTKTNVSVMPEDSLLEDPGLEAVLERGGISLGLQARLSYWPLDFLGLELVAGGAAYLPGDWETKGGVTISGTDEGLPITPYFGLYVMFGGTQGGEE